MELLVDPSLSGASWVGEIETRPETTGPQLKKVSIPVMELSAMPKASAGLLDDAAVDVGQWLTDSVATAFAIAEGAAFLSGDGVKSPRGILSYTFNSNVDFVRNWGVLQYCPAGSTTPTDRQIVDALINVQTTLRAPYRANAQWLVARDSVRKLRQLRDLQDRPIWTTDPGQIANGTADRLLGWPIRYSEDMPAIGANALAVLCGDFRQGYCIVDRLGIRVLRDPYTAKPYVLFYTTKRVGGSVVDFNAIKAIKWSTS